MHFASLGFHMLHQHNPLHFDSTLSDAISRLKVSIPPWIVVLEKNTTRTQESRDALVKCLTESRTLEPMQIVLLSFTEMSQLTWQDLRIPFFLVAFSREHERYVAILRLDSHESQIRLYCPIYNNLSHLSVDGERLPVHGELKFPDTTRLVEFKFERHRVVIKFPSTTLVSVSTLHQCSICKASLSSEEQEAHMLECSSKQQTQLDEKAKEILSRIDAHLQARNLERNSVAADGYCYLRALLLAQGKDSDEAAVMSLFQEIWAFAKEKRFSCLLLTSRQREELSAIEKPEEHLVKLQFSSSTGISRDSAFDAFWNVISYWTAPVIRKDIYLISNEATTCTLFPQSGFQSNVPLVAASSAISTREAVALLHLSHPVLHIEWLSVITQPSSPIDDPPASPMTITSPPRSLPIPSDPSPPAAPSSAVAPASVPASAPAAVPTAPTLAFAPDPPAPASASAPSTLPTPTPPVLTSAIDQLSLLLSGKSFNLSQASPNGWWQSLNGVFEKFSMKTGKLVWYSRQQSDTWMQHPVGELPPTCLLECSLARWLEWREKVANMPSAEVVDLFYLTDVEVSKKELDEFNSAIPLLSLLDDRVSPYSLHYYLYNMCPNLALSVPDLRPRLYFAPGIIPGVVTTGLHLDGLGHLMSYNWSLGLSNEKDASNLIDIYPSEEQLGVERYHQLRSTVGSAMSLSGLDLPHSVTHHSVASLAHGCDEYENLAQQGITPIQSVELRSGEVIILPAGQPHAFKKWSSSILVNFAGDIAWLGLNVKEAAESIKQMLKVEREVLEKSYCLPEVSMLACLMFVSKTPSELAKQHLTAFYDYLEEIITKERNDFAQLNNTSSKGVLHSHDELWLCTTCSKVIINSILWCHLTDETYCLSCYAELGLKKRGTSKRARGSEDFAISFRFEHPDVLWTLLNAARANSPVAVSKPSSIAPPTPSLLPTTPSAPPIAVPPPVVIVPAAPPPSLSPVAVPLSTLSPSDILRRLSECISLRREDSSHELCQVALRTEKDTTLDKQQREQLLRLNHDYPHFCHSKDAMKACPLRSSDPLRELTYEEEFRRKYRCSMVVKGGKCNKTATWTRPLYTCSGDAHRQERFLFHLDCAGYDNILVPSGAALLCLDCIKSKRDHLSVSAYRSVHIWETLIAPAELYQQGYRLIQIPRDGLCFFTVLYMLSEKYVLSISLFFYSLFASQHLKATIND